MAVPILQGRLSKANEGPRGPFERGLIFYKFFLCRVYLTPEDARQSLNEHVAAKGAEIRAKYGPCIGWRELLQILEDRECVRYPCEIAFDSGKLNPGEFAHPAPKGEKPEDGFTIHVHPVFKLQLQEIPLLVLYQLVPRITGSSPRPMTLKPSAPLCSESPRMNITIRFANWPDRSAKRATRPAANADADNFDQKCFADS